MKRSLRGFTLLELSVAIAIFGVLAVTAYGVFGRVLSAKQIVEARADEAAVARTTIGRIVRDIRAVSGRAPNRTAGPAPGVGLPTSSGQAGSTTPSATPPAGGRSNVGFVSIDHTEGQVPLDEIAFTSVVRRPLSLASTASDLAVVHYFVRPEEGRPGRFILYRESVSTLSGESIDLAAPNPEATSAIVDGITGLRFRFFDGQEWVEEWSSTVGKNIGRMPLAVEIALALEGSDGVVERYHTAIDLPSAQAMGTTPELASGAVGGPGGGAGKGEAGFGKGKLGKGNEKGMGAAGSTRRRPRSVAEPGDEDEDDEDDDEDEDE